MAQSTDIVGNQRSGHEGTGKKALDSVYRELNTKYGAKSWLLHMWTMPLTVPLPYCLILQPKKTEVYSHSHRAGLYWESFMGHGDRAFEYFMETCPADNERPCGNPCDRALCSWTVYRKCRQSFRRKVNVHWLTEYGFNGYGWLCRRNFGNET